MHRRVKAGGEESEHERERVYRLETHLGAHLMRFRRDPTSARGASTSLSGPNTLKSRPRPATGFRAHSIGPDHVREHRPRIRDREVGDGVERSSVDEGRN